MGPSGHRTPAYRRRTLPVAALAAFPVWAWAVAANAAVAATTATPAEETTGPVPSAAPDLAALIACEREPGDFLALARTLQDPLRAVALGWRPLPQRNLFLTEYALSAPIRVFGHETRHIALSGDNVMAVLDLPDPRPLAQALELEAVIDTPQKAMFGRELRSAERVDPDSGATRLESVILNVSNVESHPGQTLAGCSYSIETITENPPEADDPAVPVDAGATIRP